MRTPARTALFLAAALGAASALCPFSLQSGRPLPSWHAPVDTSRLRTAVAAGYPDALAALDFEAVKSDIKALLTTDNPLWPADYGNYGPFFVRLAWHCAGTYRASDGRGGCDGGRQRFDPERSWADNTNLDKARALLLPIKEKYGLGLSWGDLITLTGTTAIEAMGGPKIGFCAGRQDDDDNSESVPLGPSAEQYAYWPCGGEGNPNNGSCPAPLGANTVGLIYVNPEGPMGQPDPVGSSADIRDVFGRMTMNDYETVALIGGGHTFGKAHGACNTPGGEGQPPNVNESHPWEGKCSGYSTSPTGKGVNTVTAGFEGPWTANPTKWDNDYFVNLLSYSWTNFTGPGGHQQWHTTDAGAPTAPTADGSGTQELLMLTTDVALKNDASYLNISKLFAANDTLFQEAFAAAWYKLMARDMGPVTRCTGPDVPPAQSWQHPLPAASAESQKLDYSAVADHIKENVLTITVTPGVLGPPLVRLAWQCASTFRQTDYLGGCNGARIRYPPGSDWAENAGTDEALMLLHPTKDKFGDALSWADLIVLGGTVAVQFAAQLGNVTLDLAFCPGRVDDTATGAAAAWQFLESTNLTGAVTDTNWALREKITLLGLTDAEFVALSGGHSLGWMHSRSTNFVDGSWTANPTVLDNSYFKNLLNSSKAWAQYTASDSAKTVYKAADEYLYMLQSDMLILWDAQLRSIAVDYASNNTAFVAAFGAAWTKIMNADRFNGPTGNVCNVGAPTPSPSPSPSPSSKQVSLVGAALVGTATSIGAFALRGAAVWYHSALKAGASLAGHTQLQEPLLGDGPEQL